MIGWTMRRLPPGSFVWLMLHELRLSREARTRRPIVMVIGWAMLLAWIAVGVWIATLLQEVPIHAGPVRLTAAAAGSIVLFTFMTTQAILGSQRTLYGAGDLDLLFSAPIAPGTVMRAKLIGIAATVVLSFAVLVLPITLPIAILGHPQLFGIPALLLALALTAACLGLAITLLLARIAGPRAARTVGQIVAALSGGAIFIVSQFISNGGERGRGGVMILFDRLSESGFGAHGVGALPGRAAFGDPLAAGAVLAGSILLFLATTASLQAWFLGSYRAGAMKLARTRRARGTIARHFRRTLFASIFAKEWRLLARDPALAFQIVLRLVYLAPLFIIALRPGSDIPLGPSLAFASVVIAGQIAGSFAWLAVSAEDSPDLLAVAPVDKAALNHAKLMAAIAMGAPFFVLLPVAIAFQTIPGALVTLAATVFAGWIAGQIEIAFGKPAPRAAFRKRQSGSVIGSILGMIVSIALGGAAAAAVYFL